MIPRSLVPRDLRFPAPDPSAKKPARTYTPLDSRTVVPRDLPITPIDPKSKIPSHVPLDVIPARSLIARDMPANPFGDMARIPDHVPLTILDSRVVVPPGLELGKFEVEEPLPLSFVEDVVDPDILNTGEVQFLSRSADERGRDWNRISRIGSVFVHVALIAFLLATPKLFPMHVPTQAELDLARRQLNFVYLPPGADTPRSAPRSEPSSPKMRIDPQTLNRVAPKIEASPAPAAPVFSPAPPTLPAAPTPQLPADQPPAPRASAPRLENPAAPTPNPSLQLPHMSPGRALEQSVQEATKGQGGEMRQFEGPLPQGRGGGAGGGGRGGGGQSALGGGVQILTPTEGVDFSSYIERLLARVEQNWYAIIPESARLGDKGRVILQFRINKDGSLPGTDPALVRTSGKEPLDRAAMSAIHASNPFEPLPPAFSGPSIELRFIFLYNLPLEYQ